MVDSVQDFVREIISNNQMIVCDMVVPYLTKLLKSTSKKEPFMNILNKLVEYGKSNTITPWIIKEFLSSNNPRSAVLSVTITNKNKSYTRELSFENVLGIIAFYRSLGNPHPLSMCGCNFPNYEKFIDAKVITENPVDAYIIMIDNQLVKYNSEFVTGLFMS